MSTQALTRISGICLLIGSILAFVGERISYNYAQPTQNTFQSVFYVPGKTMIFLGVILVLMGLPSLWAYLTPKTKVLGPVAVFLTFYGLTTPMTAFPLQLFLRTLAEHPAVQATSMRSRRLTTCRGSFY
ncbi:MAG: hypothetical protein JOZ18_12855 [Chloroflexi bacterium]|nr:hypothetical protein [Chloroflexota bacterium]